MTKQRSWLLTASILSFFVLLLFFLGCQKSPSSVKIGYVGSLSGKYAPLGTSARDGAVLAEETVNSQGGVGGKTVELIFYDSEGSPEKAAAAVRHFADEGIQFIIGPLTSASATAMLPHINRGKILTIGPVIAGENLAHRDDFFIKLYPSTRTFGNKLAYLILNEHEKVSVISDMKNRQYCETLFDSFSNSFEQGGGEKPRHITFASGSEVEYSRLSSLAVAGSTGSVLFCTSALDTAIFSQHLKRVAPSISLFSSSWPISQTLLENGGDAINGMRFFVPFNYGDSSSSFNDFEGRFSDRFGTKSTYAAMFNYEAVLMLVTILKKNPAAGSSEIRTMLLDQGLHGGVQNEFAVDSYGDAQRLLLLHQVKEGAFRRVW